MSFFFFWPPAGTVVLPCIDRGTELTAPPDTEAVLTQNVDLGAIYSGLGKQSYHLKSMVCFYGAHYHAFVWSSGRWFTFDDSAVSAVGVWRTVIQKCRLGHIQPAVLLFERVGVKTAASGPAAGAPGWSPSPAGLYPAHDAAG